MTQANSEPRRSEPRRSRPPARRSGGPAGREIGLPGDVLPSDVLLADRYRLEERVGRGGMADVWRATDTRLDRTVAVKLLHPHLLPDATSRARFVAEARAAARLAHPGIVAVHDVVEDGDRTAIIFQFVPGESLADQLAREGPLPPEVAARLAGEVAEALDHAHRAGVIHRDVKPANVVLDLDGRARLVDFGIARVLTEAAARLTGDGDAVGTLRYMAPEQLTGAVVDERTDLFGLGMLLVEMLTGRPAFTATSPVGLLEAERAGPPELPGVPPDLGAIASGLLAFEPEARPATAGEVARALGGLALGDLGPDARPVTRDSAGPTDAPGATDAVGAAGHAGATGPAVATGVAVASGVADPTAAAGALISGQSAETAIIPVVEPAAAGPSTAREADAAAGGHSDARAAIVAAGASVAASLRALARGFGPSIGDGGDDAPAGHSSPTTPTAGRTRRLRAGGLPALLAIALLAAAGIVVVGSSSIRAPAQAVPSDDRGGAVVEPTPAATPISTPVPQPADAGAGGGKAKGRGKGGR